MKTFKIFLEDWHGINVKKLMDDVLLADLKSDIKTSDDSAKNKILNLIKPMNGKIKNLKQATPAIWNSFKNEIENLELRDKDYLEESSSQLMSLVEEIQRLVNSFFSFSDQDKEGSYAYALFHWATKINDVLRQLNESLIEFKNHYHYHGEPTINKMVDSVENEFWSLSLDFNWVCHTLQSHLRQIS